MTTIMQRYSLLDFEGIKSHGFEANLDPAALAIIQDLASQVGAPEYVRTPQFTQRQMGGGQDRDRGRGNRRKKNKATELTDDAWEAIRNFEATQIQKREGIDASIDLIRKAMNKISEKTYDVLSKQIFEEIKKVGESDIDDVADDLGKVATAAFDIASSNGFYSKLYARLYEALWNHFKDIFGPPLLNAVDGFRESYLNVAYVKAEDDYDQFCANNKANSQRKALGVFFVNLCEAGIDGLDKARVIALISDIQEQLLVKIDMEGTEPLVDELAGLEGDMLIAGKEILGFEEEWPVLMEKVVCMSKMKAKDHASLTNKTVFKHMDISDALK